jgi:iron complex outermembrane recepter protein
MTTRMIVVFALFLAATFGVEASSSGDACGVRAERCEFDIDEMDLRVALRKWSATTGMGLSVNDPDIDGKRSVSVHGSMYALVALRQMLAGSGLRVESINLTTVSIRNQRSPELARFPPNPDKTVLTSSTEALQQIDVTGSRIPETSQTNSPSRSITLTELKLSGVTSAADAFSNVPQAFPAGGTADTSLIFSSAPSPTNVIWASGVDMRGLGNSATASLINGHPMAPSAGANGVYSDIRTIPFSLLSRIDVQTDSASAIYGPEAIAGVANYFIRLIHPGAKSQLQMHLQTEGGGASWLASQEIGVPWGNGQAGLFIEMSGQDPIDAANRESTEKIALAGYPVAWVSPRQRGITGYGNLSRDIGDVRVRADVSYARRDLRNLLVSNAFGGMTSTNEVRAEQYWSFVEMSLPFPSPNWNGRVDGGVSGSSARIDRTDDAPSIGWFDVKRGTTTSRLQFAEVHVNGKLIDNWAGPVRGAFELGTRRYQYRKSDPHYASASMNISHGVMELSIPLAESRRLTAPEVLGLTLALRGELQSRELHALPQIGLHLTPLESLRFRGTWSRTWKPPALYFQVRSNESQAIVDVADPSAPGETRRVIARSGANASLDAERATATTVGFDYTPSANFRISATYYDIRYEGQILPVPASYDDILRLDTLSSLRKVRGEYSDAEVDELVSGILANPANNLVGGCSVKQYTIGPCAERPQGIYGVMDLRPQNLATTHANGVDLLIESKFDTRFGVVDASFDGTVAFDHKYKLTEAAPFTELASTTYSPIAVRFRTGLGFTHRGGAHAHAYVNFAGRSRNNSIDPPARIASQAVLDVVFGYDSMRGSAEVAGDYSLALVVKNALNKEPPPVWNANGFNYDAKNFDPYGRLIYLTWEKRFR